MSGTPGAFGGEPDEQVNLRNEVAKENTSSRLGIPSLSLSHLHGLAPAMSLHESDQFSVMVRVILQSLEGCDSSR